jgi:hypothetical protein
MTVLEPEARNVNDLFQRIAEDVSDVRAHPGSDLVYPPPEDQHRTTSGDQFLHKGLSAVHSGPRSARPEPPDRGATDPKIRAGDHGSCTQSELEPARRARRRTPLLLCLGTSEPSLDPLDPNVWMLASLPSQTLWAVCDRSSRSSWPEGRTAALERHRFPRDHHLVRPAPVQVGADRPLEIVHEGVHLLVRRSPACDPAGRGILLGASLGWTHGARTGACAR